MNRTLPIVLCAATVALMGCNRAEHPSPPSTTVVTPSAPSTTPPAIVPVPAPSASSSATVSTPSDNSGASSSSPTPGTKAQDTSGNNPTGNMTPQQENNEMPKAGQANNHSSTSMEESRGKQ